MITLNDTFNGRAISRHRTVEAAIRAQHSHARAVERANGRGAYLTYSITDSDGNRVQVEYDLYERAMEAAS